MTFYLQVATEILDLQSISYSHCFTKHSKHCLSTIARLEIAEVAALLKQRLRK